MKVGTGGGPGGGARFRLGPLAARPVPPPPHLRPGNLRVRAVGQRSRSPWKVARTRTGRREPAGPAGGPGRGAAGWSPPPLLAAGRPAGMAPWQGLLRGPGGRPAKGNAKPPAGRLWAPGASRGRTALLLLGAAACVPSPPPRSPAVAPNHRRQRAPLQPPASRSCPLCPAARAEEGHGPDAAGPSLLPAPSLPRAAQVRHGAQLVDGAAEPADF